MQTEIETVPCCRCNAAIFADMAHDCFGMCFQCQCEAHACGEIDMDATDGFADYTRDRCDDDNEGATEEDVAVAEGRAEWIESAPATQHANELHRLAVGVSVNVTVRGNFYCDIPF
jgi:hypothetical protein